VEWLWASSWTSVNDGMIRECEDVLFETGRVFEDGVLRGLDYSSIRGLSGPKFFV